MFEWLAQTVFQSVTRYGYLAVFLYMFLETASVLHFVPSELVVPFAAALLVDDPTSFALFVAVTTVGATLGSLLDYSLARRYGITALERYGHVVRLSRADVERGQRLFLSFGEWTVFVGRLLPFVRAVIGFPAGLAEMDRKRFVVYTAAGTAVFDAALTALAYSGTGQPSPLDVGRRLATVEGGVLLHRAVGTLVFALRVVVERQATAQAYVATHRDLVAVLAGIAALVAWVGWWQRDWIRRHPERARAVGVRSVRLLGFVVGGAVVLGALASPESAFRAITWAWNDPVELLAFGLSKRLALVVTGLAVAGGGALLFELVEAIPPGLVRRLLDRLPSAG